MTSTELLLVVAACAIVAGVGVAVAPRAVLGSAPGGARGDAPAPGVGALIASCIGVVAVWDDASSPTTDVLLWHGDRVDPGVVNGSELVLLSFSSVMGTATATIGAGEAWTDARPDNDGLVSALVRGDAGAPARFRASDGAEQRIVATDIGDVRVERSGSARGGGGVVVRLTWASPASDEAPEGGAFRARWVGLRTERGGG